MFDEIYAAVINAKNKDELEKNLACFKSKGINPVKFPDTKFPFCSVVERLAFEGKNETVEWLVTLGAKRREVIYGYARADNEERLKNYSGTEHYLSEVALGYAKTGNDSQVKKYQDLGANVSFIAEGYALAGNDKKVKEYEKLNTDVGQIVEGYARAGNYKKVNEYLATKEEFINVILQTYADAGHHALLLEFEQAHPVQNISVISAGYNFGGHLKKSQEYKTIGDLKKQGVVGESIIAVIKRLQQGEQNKFNPYWANSGKKLEAIIKAVNETISNQEDIANALQDKNSPLYKALNTSRLAPLTFLGKKPSTKAKSLLEVEEVNKPKP